MNREVRAGRRYQLACDRDVGRHVIAGLRGEIGVVTQDTLLVAMNESSIFSF